MRTYTHLQLLKILNSNTENPYLIWDNRTRAELTKYLEEQQQAIVRTVSTTVLCVSYNEPMLMVVYILLNTTYFH